MGCRTLVSVPVFLAMAWVVAHALGSLPPAIAVAVVLSAVAIWVLRHGEPAQL